MIDSINHLAKNAAVSPVGELPPPDPIQSIQVKGQYDPTTNTITAPGEILHATATHNAPVNRGIAYHWEVDTDPGFTRRAPHRGHGDPFPFPSLGDERRQREPADILSSLHAAVPRQRAAAPHALRGNGAGGAERCSGRVIRARRRCDHIGSYQDTDGREPCSRQPHEHEPFAQPSRRHRLSGAGRAGTGESPRTGLRGEQEMSTLGTIHRTIRGYQQGDFDAIRRIHESTEIDYKFPDLNSPLFVVTKVVEIDGKIVAAGGLYLLAEAYLWMSPEDWGTPQEKLDAVDALQQSAFHDAWMKGIDCACLWLPPGMERFGERLVNDLGWSRDRNGWVSFSRKLNA